MAGSRGFLLVLLAATVTCIVVVQVSLDGWILNGTHFSLLGQNKEQKQISVTSFEVNNVTKTTLPIIVMKEKFSTKLSTVANIVKQKQIDHLSSTRNSNSSANSTRSPPLPMKEVHSKPSQRVQAKVRVRPVQVGKSSNTILGHQSRQQLLIDRQSRLQEILKHSDVIQSRAKGDPMRALKPLPIIHSDNVTRVFVLTYFRSGSSFLGELLQQNWKTFYQFEPLHYMAYDSRVADNKTAEALNLFNNIYRCNFTNLNNYLQWIKRPKNQFLFAHSLFLWFSCRTNPRMCFSPEFVSAVCNRSPVQVTKVTRLHMRQLRTFLQENSDLGMKVVYLTRDPRGILSSRWTLDWCNGSECSDPNVLCNEMTEDMSIFRELQKKEPLKFVHVRYEDLALNPEKEATKLLKFLRIPFSQSVQRFLRSHTTARRVDNLDPYSTRRNSSSMAFSWRQRFSFEQVKNVQASCGSVIQQLNHSLITTSSQLDGPNVSRAARKNNLLTSTDPKKSNVKSKLIAFHNKTISTNEVTNATKNLLPSKNNSFATLKNKNASSEIFHLVTPVYSNISQNNTLLKMDVIKIISSNSTSHEVILQN